MECPITHNIIQSPVLNFQDNHLYEKSAFIKWMNLQGTCPRTRKLMMGGGDYFQWLNNRGCNVIRKQTPFIGHRLIQRFKTRKNELTYFSGKIIAYDKYHKLHLVAFDDGKNYCVDLQDEHIELFPRNYFEFN